MPAPEEEPGLLAKTRRVAASPWTGATAAITVAVLALWLVLRGPIADPASTPPPAITPAPVPWKAPAVTGTTPVDAARLTAAATRYQADRAAAAAEQSARIQRDASERAARTQAFATDNTGRRAALLAMFAGGIALLSAWLGWQAHRETVARNKREADDALVERRDERYSTAIMHLAHASAAVRGAGIYALADLSLADAQRRLPVLQTLIAYLTDHYAQEDVTPATTDEPPVDVVAAWVTVARLRGDNGAPAAYLANADLRGFDLAGGNLRHADLRGALLTGADLQSALLAAADLSGAKVNGSNLTRAELRFANLEGADLDDVQMEGADLVQARLSGAALVGSRARGANFNGLRPWGSPAGRRIARRRAVLAREARRSQLRWRRTQRRGHGQRQLHPFSIHRKRTRRRGPHRGESPGCRPHGRKPERCLPRRC